MKRLPRDRRDQVDIDISEACVTCCLIGCLKLFICMYPAKHGKLIIVCGLQSDTHTIDPGRQIFRCFDRSQGTRIHLNRNLGFFVHFKNASKGRQYIHDLAR